MCASREMRNKCNCVRETTNDPPPFILLLPFFLSITGQFFFSLQFCSVTERCPGQNRAVPSMRLNRERRGRRKGGRGEHCSNVKLTDLSERKPEFAHNWKFRHLFSYQCACTLRDNRNKNKIATL